MNRKFSGESPGVHDCFRASRSRKLLLVCSGSQGFPEWCRSASAPTDAAARHGRADGVGWADERRGAQVCVEERTIKRESKREKDDEREVLNSTERPGEVEGGMERIAGRAAEWE